MTDEAWSMAPGQITRGEYAAIDSIVRAQYGPVFDYWVAERNGGKLDVTVRASPSAEQVVINIVAKIYPDTITNPNPPPTVDGTTITRDMR